MNIKEGKFRVLTYVLRSVVFTQHEVFRGPFYSDLPPKLLSVTSPGFVNSHDPPVGRLHNNKQTRRQQTPLQILEEEGTERIKESLVTLLCSILTIRSFFLVTSNMSVFESVYQGELPGVSYFSLFFFFQAGTT